MAITISRIGQNNGAGDTKALFLVRFSGEVLTAFEETNVAKSRHMVMTIQDGKGASFPATWKATADYHTPGDDIAGQIILNSERYIYIDNLLVAAVWIPKIDLLMNHWDYRREYARQLGAALARTYDKNVLRVGILAARASATVTGGNGGTVITAATAGTNAQALVDAIAAGGQAMDEKDVPGESRYAFLKPAQYTLLWNSDIRAINRDFQPTVNGSQSEGHIMRIGGFEIVKTNNLPQENVTTGPAAYQGNFTTTVCLLTQRGATGTVELMGMASEMEYWPTRKATYMDSSYAVGHGILRPECAVEIKTA